MPQGASLWFKHLGTLKTVKRQYGNLSKSLYRPSPMQLDQIQHAEDAKAAAEHAATVVAQAPSPVEHTKPLVCCLVHCSLVCCLVHCREQKE